MANIKTPHKGHQTDIDLFWGRRATAKDNSWTPLKYTQIDAPEPFVHALRESEECSDRGDKNPYVSLALVVCVPGT